MNYHKHIVSSLEETEIRIDKYIAEKLELFSRSQLKQRIKKLLVNGKEAKLSKKIGINDCLEIFYTDPSPPDLIPEKLPFSILYENEDVIVVNKAQGMVVHPGAGRIKGTLANALVFYCEQIRKNFENTHVRPGIVHRLDKDTSGVIITAKNLKAHEYLAKQFARSRVRKVYLAVAGGQPPAQYGEIDTYIIRDTHNRKKFRVGENSGKKAITHYTLLQTKDIYSLLRLQPGTGRTHQLRVHLRYINCPILGDPLYGRKDKHFPDATLMLHAFSLTIRLPGEKENHTFTAPMPEHFENMLKNIGFSKDRIDENM